MAMNLFCFLMRIENIMANLLIQKLMLNPSLSNCDIFFNCGSNLLILQGDNSLLV